MLNVQVYVFVEKHTLSSCPYCWEVGMEFVAYKKAQWFALKKTACEFVTMWQIVHHCRRDG